MLIDTIKPYLIVGACGLWLSSLVATGIWQNKAGHVAERAAWQDRQMDELIKASLEIERLTEQAREVEKVHAQRLTDISTRYEKEKVDVAAKRDFVIAGLRSGGLRLRDPNAPDLQTCRSEASGTTASPGERDGATGGELSRTTSEALVGMMSEADEVTKQLTECQAIIRSDRQAVVEP